jgi:hypothetical protein
LPTSANGILFNVEAAALRGLFLVLSGELASSIIGTSLSSGLKISVADEAVLLFLAIACLCGEDKGLTNCAGIDGTAGVGAPSKGDLYSKAIPGLFSNGVVITFHQPRERCGVIVYAVSGTRALIPSSSNTVPPDI